MRIALLDDYQSVALEVADWSRLRQRCEIVPFNRPFKGDDAATLLQDFDILCTLRERMAIPAELIGRLPRLKYIVVTGKRFDAVDVAVMDLAERVVDDATSIDESRLPGRWADAHTSHTEIPARTSVRRRRS